MTTSKRLSSLDLLRVFAIFWVMGHHLLDGYFYRDLNSPLSVFFISGLGGVDLFFVLSGYLIGGILLSEARRTSSVRLTHFWYRRWMRTFPAYFATLCAILAIDMVYLPDRPWRHFWSYLFFLQNYTQTVETFRFGWTWSLCVEEGFYLLLPVLGLACLKWIPRASPAQIFRGIAVCGFLFSALGRLLVYLHLNEIGEAALEKNTWMVYYRTHWRLDGLAVGLFISTLPKPTDVRFAIGLIGAATVGLVLVIYMSLPDIQKYEIFAVRALLFGMILYGALADNRLTRRPMPAMAFLADLSYALFLVHPIFTKAVLRLLPNADLSVKLAAFFLLTFGAALALRYFIERPFLALRDRSRTSSPAAPLAAPGEK